MSPGDRWASGCSAAWQRASFGTKRSWVQIPPPRQLKHQVRGQVLNSGPGLCRFRRLRPRAVRRGCLSARPGERPGRVLARGALEGRQAGQSDEDQREDTRRREDREACCGRAGREQLAAEPGAEEARAAAGRRRGPAGARRRRPRFRMADTGDVTGRGSRLRLLTGRGRMSELSDRTGGRRCRRRSFVRSAPPRYA